MPQSCFPLFGGRKRGKDLQEKRVFSDKSHSRLNIQLQKKYERSEEGVDRCNTGCYVKARNTGFSGVLNI